jgi:hypothetical protein
MPPLRALNNKTNKKYHNGRHHAQECLEHATAAGTK